MLELKVKVDILRKQRDVGDKTMKFGITANPEIAHALKTTKAVVQLLHDKHEIVLESDIAKTLGRPGKPLETIKADFILAIGGDGTVLRALQRTNVRVLGINTGSLGFLAEGDSKSVPMAISRLQRGDYTVEKRLKIKVTLNGKRLYDCTNEAVVHTAHVAKIRHYEIRVDDAVAEKVRADGIIVATPTGSTSYAMSAGGPILDPRVEAFVVSAIAPFKSSFHPFVVPASSKVQVSFLRPRPGLLVLDGQHDVPLEGDEKVVLTGSEKHAKLVRFGDNFYSRIHEKLTNP